MNDWNKNRLGFGLMRLPQKDGVIDIESVAALADAYLAKGFTYFDTAYVYAGAEEAFRKAVASRHPRESYTIASKMAGWQLTDSFGPGEMFQEQLRRCGVDYFDYYLLHSLSPSRVPFYEKYNCWDFCARMKAEGKIKRFGFSFHDRPALLDKLLTEHPEVDFVQLQINYVDWDDNAIYSGENYAVCEKHGKDVVVMEPVKGGFLASLAPELEAKLRALDPAATPASYALRFAASLPNVKMVLSGMNSLAQMEDNLSTFKNFKPLTDAERAVLREVTAGIRAVPTVACTACRYCCEGCPAGINIPEIFKSYNMLLTFGEHIRPHLYYTGSTLANGSARASDCVSCGQCESVCPQRLDIIENLRRASAQLDK